MRVFPTFVSKVKARGRSSLSTLWSVVKIGDGLPFSPPAILGEGDLILKYLDWLERSDRITYRVERNKN